MDLLPKRKESGPLERFKNQSAVLKQFGETGYLLYNTIDGKKTAGQIQEELSLEEGKLVEMLEFMQKNNMIALEEVQGAEPPARQRIGQPRQMEKAEEAPPVPEEEPAPEEPEEEEEKTEDVKTVGGFAKGNQNEDEGEREEPEDSSGSLDSEPETQDSVDPFRKRGTQIRPIETESEDSETRRPVTTVRSSERTPVKDSEPEPIQSVPPKKEMVAPRAIEPQARAMRPEVRSIKSESKKEAEPKLSPLEKTIYDKYGMIGVKVYSLIDGEKSAEDILNETGISEDKLIEMLEFMDKKGIIKLEKPWQEESEDSKTSGRPEDSDEEASDSGNESETEPAFAPMEEKEDRAMAPAQESREIAPIDLVAKAKAGPLKEIVAKVKIGLKFGGVGLKAYEQIDGNTDIVQMSIKTYLSLDALDAIFAYLAELGLAMFRKLAPEDIVSRYGDDGLAIYKKYGRDGILLYELIGKEKSLKDLITRSQIDPERAVNIFLFIHKILGLEFPIEINQLYRQLEIDPNKTKPGAGSAAPSMPPKPK